MARGTADTSLIKQGFKKLPYSEEQLKDFEACCDPNTGHLYFMKTHMKIQHPTLGGIDFNPYDYQEGLVENYSKYRYSINMLGRQMGKTTVAAGYLLWYAMFKPDSTILVAAHKQAGASEIMQRIRYAYEGCPNHIRAGVTEYNKGSLTMDNGSRIISATTTENTGRGMSLSLIYLDEFAFVPPRIAKEFWTSLSPTLATGGKCIITSTPNSDDDTFAMIWQQANKMFDEHGEEQDVGVNGFRPMIAKIFTDLEVMYPGLGEQFIDIVMSEISKPGFKDKKIFEGKPVAIFGGGDSALDWAVDLAKNSKVNLIHRR